MGSGSAVYPLLIVGRLPNVLKGQVRQLFKPHSIFFAQITPKLNETHPKMDENFGGKFHFFFMGFFIHWQAQPMSKRPTNRIPEVFANTQRILLFGEGDPYWPTEFALN